MVPLLECHAMRCVAKLDAVVVPTNDIDMTCNVTPLRTHNP
jgi:hypothetical protein